MVALVAQDHAVLGYKGLHVFFVPLKQGLHNGDIDDPATGVFSRPDLSDLLELFLPAAPLGLFRQCLLNIKKIFQRCFPLFQKCAGVDQDQSTHLPCADQVSAHHSFSEGCGGRQHADMVF